MVTVLISVKPVLKKSVQTWYPWSPGSNGKLSIPCILQHGATPDVTFIWQRQLTILGTKLPPRDISKTDKRFKMMSFPNHTGSVLTILHPPSRVTVMCTARNLKGYDTMTFEVAQMKSYGQRSTFFVELVLPPPPEKNTFRHV